MIKSKYSFSNGCNTRIEGDMPTIMTEFEALARNIYNRFNKEEKDYMMSIWNSVLRPDLDKGKELLKMAKKIQSENRFLDKEEKEILGEIIKILQDEETDVEVKFVEPKIKDKLDSLLDEIRKMKE